MVSDRAATAAISSSTAVDRQVGAIDRERRAVDRRRRRPSPGTAEVDQGAGQVGERDDPGPPGAGRGRPAREGGAQPVEHLQAAIAGARGRPDAGDDQGDRVVDGEAVDHLVRARTGIHERDRTARSTERGPGSRRRSDRQRGCRQAGRPPGPHRARPPRHSRRPTRPACPAGRRPGEPPQPAYALPSRRHGRRPPAGRTTRRPRRADRRREWSSRPRHSRRRSGNGSRRCRLAPGSGWRRGLRGRRR